MEKEEKSIELYRKWNERWCERDENTDAKWGHLGHEIDEKSFVLFVHNFF